MENVHTYAHARRVRNAPQRTKMRYQTFLWPTSTPPPSYPDYQHEFSEFGPPVRHVEDLIACHYLSIHHPNAFKLRTSTVLDSVSDRDFDSYEQRKKQEARRRFNEKYSSYANVKNASYSSGDRKINTQKKAPKRSKFFDDLVSSDDQRTKTQLGSQAVEHVNIHYAEEVILPPCCEVIIEHQFDPPLVHHQTITLVPQPQRAQTVEVQDEFQEQASCCQQDSNDTWSIVVKPVHWSKRMTRSYSLIPRLRRNIHIQVWSSRLAVLRAHRVFKKSTFCSVQRNFKKRRRKCEPEHAH
uniref:Uncharacterized protein n=1 Tax=Osugoroshi virus TaxID=2202814 RepID=A0A7R7T1X0_9VIRU|nr:hypothetical protein [Osugoroshi virus]